MQIKTPRQICKVKHLILSKQCITAVLIRLRRCADVSVYLKIAKMVSQVVNLLVDIVFAFLSSAVFFQNELSHKDLSGTLSECQKIWILTRTDVRRSVGPGLGPNCLQRLSAADKFATCKERVKTFEVKFHYIYVYFIGWVRRF